MTVADQLTLGLGGSHSRNAQTIFSGFCTEAKLGQNIISRWFQTEPKKANTNIFGDPGADGDSPG